MYGEMSSENTESHLFTSDPELFALCHSEGEKRPKNLAQSKLREGGKSLKEILRP